MSLLNRGRNNILRKCNVQSRKFTERTYSNYESKKERSRRSFQLPSQSIGEEYFPRKSIGPEQLQCCDNEEKHLGIIGKNFLNAALKDRFII